MPWCKCRNQFLTWINLRLVKLGKFHTLERSRLMLLRNCHSSPRAIYHFLSLSRGAFVLAWKWFQNSFLVVEWYYGSKLLNEVLLGFRVGSSFSMHTSLMFCTAIKRCLLLMLVCELWTRLGILVSRRRFSFKWNLNRCLRASHSKWLLMILKCMFFVVDSHQSKLQAVGSQCR